MYSSSTGNQKSVDSLHNNLTALTTSSKQVDLGIDRFALVTTGINKFPSHGTDDDLEQTEITQASLVRTSDEGRSRPLGQGCAWGHLASLFHRGLNSPRLPFPRSSTGN